MLMLYSLMMLPLRYSSILKDSPTEVLVPPVLINYEFIYCRQVRSYGHLVGMSTFFLAIAKSIGSQLLTH
jgi:hypothetical protein